MLTSIPTKIYMFEKLAPFELTFLVESIDEVCVGAGVFFVHRQWVQKYLPVPSVCGCFCSSLLPIELFGLELLYSNGPRQNSWICGCIPGYTPLQLGLSRASLGLNVSFTTTEAGFVKQKELQNAMFQYQQSGTPTSCKWGYSPHKSIYPFIRPRLVAEQPCLLCCQQFRFWVS